MCVGGGGNYHHHPKLLYMIVIPYSVRKSMICIIVGHLEL